MVGVACSTCRFSGSVAGPCAGRSAMECTQGPEALTRGPACVGMVPLRGRRLVLERGHPRRPPVPRPHRRCTCRQPATRGSVAFSRAGPRGGHERAALARKPGTVHDTALGRRGRRTRAAPSPARPAQLEQLSRPRSPLTVLVVPTRSSCGRVLRITAAPMIRRRSSRPRPAPAWSCRGPAHPPTTPGAPSDSVSHRAPP